MIPTPAMIPRIRFGSTRSVMAWFCSLGLLCAWSAPTLWGAAKRSFVETGSFVHHPDIQIRLIAAEPDVIDPVALKFDASGRMYVVEMRDYPYGYRGAGKPGGRVRQLEFDRRGVLKRSTVFADGLSFPTSLALWKGGVYVSAPPEIVYLKDLDGDGRSDLRQTLYSGFVLGVTDSNFNGLRWAVDNRIHGVTGGNGGSIRLGRHGKKLARLGDHDFAFDPRSLQLDRTFHTGAGFGLVFNAWGDSFTPYNIDHILQRILPAHYLERNPSLPPINTTTSISDHGRAARIYAVAQAQTRVNHPEQAGHFSAAGGMGILSTGRFSDALEGSILVCDVVSHLVHRDVLEPDGSIYRARRSREEAHREFLASRDLAFRPVGVEPGPDGALYLIDMQRDVIEHPDYIPEKVRKHLDIRAGDDRGRIYRITPRGGLPWAPATLKQASNRDRVRALGDPNQWIRMTAQRLLLEDADPAVAPLLRRRLAAPEALTRLHALWTLEGLGALTLNDLAGFFTDTPPELRIHALRLLERHTGWANDLWPKVLGLAEDASPRVRFQTALTLGAFDLPGRTAALIKILERDYLDPWTRLAVKSSLGGATFDLLGRLIHSPSFFRDQVTSKTALARELGDLLGAEATPDLAEKVARVIEVVSTGALGDALQTAILAGLDKGIERSGGNLRLDPRAAERLRAMATTGSLLRKTACWRLIKRSGFSGKRGFELPLEQSLRAASDPAVPLEEREAHVRFLGLGDFDRVQSALLGLIDGKQPFEIQKAALSVIAGYRQSAAAAGLIQRWRQLNPNLRSQAIAILLRRTDFHPILLNAIETGRIALGELNLDLEQRRRLRRHSTPEVRARARALFGDEEYSNRKRLVEDWLPKLPPHGDPKAGKLVFQQQCAPCHRAGALGVDVGPDLSAVAHRSVEDLASNILDPNMAIAPSYTAVEIETQAGESYTGILKAESPSAVTLVLAQAQTREIPRTQIQSMQATGRSLMPEGFEETLTPAQLRDLISFLQQDRPDSYPPSSR